MLIYGVDLTPVAGQVATVPSFQVTPHQDCDRYRRAYAAVRDAVIFGPLFDFDAFRGVVQEEGNRVLRRDQGQSNYAGTDFWRERP